jgi:hypothetical protein
MGMFDCFTAPAGPPFQCGRGHNMRDLQCKSAGRHLDDYVMADGKVSLARCGWGAPIDHPEHIRSESGRQSIEVYSSCEVCRREHGYESANWYWWDIDLDGLRVLSIVAPWAEDDGDDAKEQR